MLNYLNLRIFIYPVNIIISYKLFNKYYFADAEFLVWALPILSV